MISVLEWWRRRQDLIEDQRLFVRHLAESDPNENNELATSYGEHPLRLAAVVVADVFMDTDISRLAKALSKRMAPDRPGREDRERVRTFLRQAESKAGGGGGLGPIHFFRPGDGRKRLGGGHELPMPPWVGRLGLVLHQFAPGMVMAATVLAAPVETAAEIFRGQHAKPVKKVRGYGVSWRSVETAKRGELERRFRKLASIDLLPAGSGLLADRRYPAGVVVVWSADRKGSEDSASWRHVCQALGIEHWRWWEGDDGRRLYPGVPVADAALGERGGHSMMVTKLAAAADQAEFGSSEATFRYELEHEVVDWLPLLLLAEAALMLGDEAARLREKLSRRTEARFQGLWLWGLGAMVGSLSACQYRLERLRQAAGVDTGRHFFDEFPILLPRPERPAVAVPKLRTSVRVGHWLRDALTDPKPASMPFNLRQARLDALDRITRDGLHEARLSLDRARLLSDIRSTNALLLLTGALTVLTLILVLRALH